MKFNITKLEITNFRSILETVTLNIKPGVFVVEGINMDENNDGNGSGKSSLVSALYWCLTGNALTNEALSDDVVNISSGKNCKVSVYITSSEGEIIITRYRKDKEYGNNLFLSMNNTDLSCHKISDTQDRINKILKIPFNLLHSTIIMMADLRSAFSKMTSQQRIQILESIRDYTLWDNVRDIANSDIKKYNKEILDKQAILNKNLGSTSTYNKLITDNETEILKRENDFNKESLLLEISKNKTIIENIEININNLVLELDTMRSVQTEDLSYLTNNLTEITEKANTKKLEIQSENFNKKSFLTDIANIDSWFINDSCKLCNRLLDRTEEEKVEKAKNKKVLEDAISVIENKISENNSVLDELRLEWTSVNSKLESKRSLQNDSVLKVKSLERQLEKLRSDVKTIENNNRTINITIDNHSATIDNLKASNLKYTEEIVANAEIVKGLEEELSVLSNKKEVSNYYYKLLSGKGELRPYLLRRDIAFLNNSIQKYIHRLFNNTEVSLQLNGASIDISITSNGINKTISSLSSGEEKRVNLAIQFALYDLVQVASQISFNLLWLDEIEVQMDPSGCQRLLELLEDKSSEVESVYWITNNQMVKENIPNRVVCKKALGCTKVEEK